MIEHTIETVLDFGVLGELSVDIIAVYEPGERGTRECGRLLEPDIRGGYRPVNIEHPALSIPENRYFLWRTYQHDETFRDAIDDALEAYSAVEAWELPQDTVQEAV